MPECWGGWLADVAETTRSYAAYLNAPRGVLPADQDELLEQDTARARAAMEAAWLEAKPTREDL